MLINRRFLWRILPILLGIVTGILSLRQIDTAEPVPFFSVDEVSFVVLVIEWTLLVTLLLGIFVSHREFVRPTRENYSWWQILPHLLMRFSVRLVITIAIVFAIMLITLVVMTLIIDLLPAAELSFSPLVTFLIVSIYVAFLSTILIATLRNLTNWRLMLLVGIVFVVGIVTAVLSSPTTDWWTRAISALGAQKETDFLFNFAFIFGGLLMLSALRDQMGGLRAAMRESKLPQRFAILVEVLFILGCLGTIGVGVFPWIGRTKTIHEIAAQGAAVAFALAILLILFTVSLYPPAFRRRSWGLLGMGAIVGILNTVGAISFAVMEMLLILIVAVWLVFFLQATEDIVEEQSTEGTLAAEMG